ncbi:delta and Notch-like epidermal growth factor-related receptor [Dreissena polymorpha]|uniref:delta and Notch-like epidermal growth factor-related receptor n=1 Tax=Dreissena polymorpha TaxID=45954 RepID=UPI002264F3B7|nr:delta and Notch-like epidermal growth factor-related receptor [Dreissena polymorpha]
MLASSRGKRSNAIPIAILITDGVSNTSPVNAATRLKENGVVIYVAMVNMHDPTGDMQQVVSKPEYLMYVQNYNSLENLVGPLSVSTCDVAQGCLPTTCRNGGTCHQGQTTYRCECPSIFTGWYCDISICTGINSPCGNRGSCSIDGDRWKCSCYPGYTGETCATNVDECASSPCINGTCFDWLNSYTCRCNPAILVFIVKQILTSVIPIRAFTARVTTM